MVTALWQNSLDDLPRQVDACFDRALSNRPAGEVQVYFRADDIAVPSASLKRLMALFQTHDSPLALALVPAWLTQPRWEKLAQWGRMSPELWCWHQHGWRHHNHAPQGKKAEFGDHRPQSTMAAELKRGFDRLSGLLGQTFSPIFTPPWNRIGDQALSTLHSIGLRAVSRDETQSWHHPSRLPELPVHVDLHTHKASNPNLARQHLLDCLTEALTRGSCGIMIHHQRMNDTAFAFLDFLLRALQRYKAARSVGFTDIL